ncbi:checkpoint protein kinase [Cordyceps javanica]|uniref:Checkpoint protein kinase n=1 Tax=Cordyceps javanica TaxID=43265 RepID=A0A545VUR6_9HYPO|nr:checkpoint protein kinase [Cordyceps javanica]TQW05455.1 checkpoint protein kinase [Cordyceps javanica]
MDERQPKQEYTPSINTPTSAHAVRSSVGPSAHSIYSAGSAAVTPKSAEVDSDAGITMAAATAEQAADADSVGSVSRSANSGKREDLELRRSTHRRRVPGILREPARRGLRMQTEEAAEVHGEEPLTTGQDPDSQQPQDLGTATSDRPAMAPSTPKLQNSAAIGKSEASQADLFYTHAQQAESNDSPHHALIPLSLTPSHERVSMELPARELNKPARPHRIDTGSVAPQLALSSERRDLAVKSQNTLCQPEPTLPPPKMPAIETLTAAQSMKKRQLVMKVNGTAYTRIDYIGRGGSGKVFRVATERGVMLALKRVSLGDELMEKDLRREIELLQRLRNVERVIQLIDYEMKREKQAFYILMEFGELDFNSLLRNRQGEAEAPSFDITFVRYYWREMLECVQAIHALAVVHSDLKPANFVLVGGRLKLIDFGIANAIQTDMTVNVHRETMAGTVNYMSPESLMDSNQYALTSMHNANLYMPASGAPKIVKVGKPSDVWSLGCILYQMVYGMPPFAKIAEQHSRIRAIVDWSYRIEIPATTEDGSHVPVALIQTMRSCLSRDQKDRPTCETLLSEGNNFCYPKEYSRAPSVAGDGKALLITKEQLGAVIQSVVLRCKEGASADDMAMAAWPSAYWTSLRKAVAQPAP